MPTLIVHAGAASIARSDIERHEQCCRRSVLRGLTVLAAGGSALDAAVAAVVILEDDPVTNAGTGATVNRAGYAELDALAMEGTGLGLGAVANLADVRNPIRVARALVFEESINLLSGPGASRFARSVGIPAIDPDSLVTDETRKRWLDRSDEHRTADTVGAVVCDDRGRTAAAVSTGGIFGKLPGRIGDTPLAGSGAYADDRIGAAVATGVGEHIMRVLLARAGLDRLQSGLEPMQAAKAAIEMLTERIDGRAGIILVDSRGRPGFAFNTPQMSHAYGSSPDDIIVGH